MAAVFAITHFIKLPNNYQQSALNIIAYASLVFGLNKPFHLYSEWDALNSISRMVIIHTLEYCFYIYSHHRRE